MAIRGIVGAVYQNNTAPISDNIALLFDWVLEVQHRKEYSYGPELHGILTGWDVTVHAYWASKNIPQGRYFVRLFIGKGDDARTLAGNVEFPALKMAEEITEMKITFEGIGQLIQEG